MKITTRLTLACAILCSNLLISSQPALSQDDDGFSDLDIAPIGSTGGNDAAKSQEAAATCGAIIAKLKGQDNRNPPNNKSEKSIVPGNWSLSCQNSKVSYENCSLTAECNDGKGIKQSASTVNLSGCVDKEVKNSAGNLICN